MESELAQAAAIAATGSSGVKAEKVEALAGWSLQETTETAPAKVRLRVGAANGTVLAVVALLPGESVNHAYRIPLMVPGGKVFVEVVAGNVEGSLNVI